MAADETLLESAAAGTASLRFYTWSEPTVSLGYFQPADIRLIDSRLANLPWVRRPSGGAALIHDREVTYALALPAGRPWQPDTSWLARMHTIIGKALGELGVGSNPYQSGLRGECTFYWTPLLSCISLPATLMIQERKSGRASGFRKQAAARALVQHGGVLLSQSAFTPVLPGIRELSGLELSAAQVADAACNAFAAETGWTLARENWTDAELVRIEVIAPPVRNTAAQRRGI